jgi:MFS family permease
MTLARPAKYAGAPAGAGRKFLLLTVLYLSQTIPMGFMMGSLPVIMRASGMSLKSIGFLFMLHLPWAFKFVYASYVDSHHSRRWGRRRTWILPMQWLTILLFIILSQAPPAQNLLSMFILCLAAALAMATNDIAVDGYATDILTPEQRPWGNTIQSGARSMGMVLGGGLALVCFESIGWQATCILMAAALFLLNLPVLGHREISPTEQPRSSRAGNSAQTPGMLALIKMADTRWMLAFLTIPTVFYFLGFQMRLPLLNDLGLSPRLMGMALIWCGSPAGILGSVVGGYLFKRLGPLPLMRWYVLAILGLSALTIFLAAQVKIAPWCGLMVLALDNLLLGIVHVWCFTLMMKASVGPQSGTRFALFSSVFLLPPLLLAPLSGTLGDALGFGWLYLFLAGLLCLGFAGAKAIARFRLQDFFKSEDF